MATTTASDAPLTGWTILVTRPASDGTALATQLGALGANVLQAPLLLIEPLPVDAAVAADLDRFDIVIVTSRSAVVHGVAALADRWPQWPAAQQWLAIGEGTAAALARYGVTAEYPGDERSEGLLAMPALAQVAGRHVLLVSGTGGRNAIAPALAARGAHIVRLDCYRRHANPAARATIDTFGHNPAPRAVLVTSVEALHNLLALAPGLASGDVRLVVPVERVAAAARAAGVRHVSIAGRAGDASMLAAVCALASTRPREERS